MIHLYDTASRSQRQAALEDIYGLLTHWRSWVTLGWHDIIHRYKGSVLGPFWITLNMAVMIGGLCMVYGGIFNADQTRYALYLSVSLPLWTLFSDSLQQGCICFSSEGMIKSIRLPYSIYAARILWRNVIVFLHNITIFVILAIAVSSGRPNFALLWIGLALFVINLGWLIVLLGTICARFRDVAQIINNFTSMLFLISPIMWQPDMVSDRAYITNYNLVNYLLEMIRTPLLGGIPPFKSYAVCIILAVVGWVGTLMFFTKFRRRIAYWI